jgi:hypothetical protein
MAEEKHFTRLQKLAKNYKGDMIFFKTKTQVHTITSITFLQLAN